MDVLYVFLLASFTTVCFSQSGYKGCNPDDEFDHPDDISNEFEAFMKKLDEIKDSCNVEDEEWNLRFTLYNDFIVPRVGDCITQSTNSDLTCNKNSCLRDFPYDISIFLCKSRPHLSNLLVKVASFNCTTWLFTASVYKEVLRYADNKNVAVSPFSLSVALGATRAAARDETSHEIKTALQLPANPNELQDLVKDLKAVLKKGKNFTYAATECILIDRKFGIRKEYKAHVEEAFLTRVEAVTLSNLASHTPRSTSSASALMDLLRNISSGLTTATDFRMKCRGLVVSAVDLQIDWLRIPKDTSFSRRPFNMAGGRSQETEFLEQTGVYSYLEDERLKARFVEIPLLEKEAGKKGVVAILVLPNEVEGIKELEGRLSEVFAEPKWSEEKVKVAIPRINVNFSMDMKRVVQHLGMKKAFHTDADFGEMLVDKQPFYLDHIIQKTSLSFTDKNNLATLTKTPAAARKLERSFKLFVADHPFMFFIKCKNVVICAATIKNPTE